jgi:radical SAM superfamily enzyme YgiQ (UPF0313 family)
MNEFRDLWRDEVDLPFWINTTLESVTDWRLAALSECGCAGIGVGLESGSEWLRNNILKRNTKNGNEILVDVFNLIKKHGIRATANSMMGFPGETKADMFETVKLMKRIKPESFHIIFVTPYFGTPIHDLAHSRGYIDVDTKPGFVDMDVNIGFRKGAIIRNPYVSEEDMQDIANKFYDYVTGRIPIRDEFMVEAAGASETAPKRTASLEESQYIDLVFENVEKEKDQIRKSRKQNRYDTIPAAYITGKDYDR